MNARLRGWRFSELMPMNDIGIVRRVAESVFGDESMMDHMVVDEWDDRVCVSSFNHTTNRMTLMTNYHDNPNNSSNKMTLIENRMRVRDAATASGATPVFFSPFKIEGGDEFEDARAHGIDPIEMIINQSKMIWGEKEKWREPDIVMRIGTRHLGKRERDVKQRGQMFWVERMSGTTSNTTRNQPGNNNDDNNEWKSRVEWS